jgi:predicted metal-binding protein
MMKSLSRKPNILRRISAEIDSGQLKEDLVLLKNTAIELGASEAIVIEKKDIVFNPVILKWIEADNMYPSIHWPLVYPKDEIREAIDAYEWGIFFRMDADADFPDYGGGPISDKNHRLTYKKIYEISTAIESAGFYMGYHLSLGLAAGNCRAVFCPEEKRCWPMIKGKVCVRPNMGRPSLEAVGIDGTAMARNFKIKLDEKAQDRILSGLVMIV